MVNKEKKMVNKDRGWMKGIKEGRVLHASKTTASHVGLKSRRDTKCNATKPSLFTISPSLPISQIFFVSNFLITFNEWSLSKITKLPSYIFKRPILFPKSSKSIRMIDLKTFYNIYICYIKNKEVSSDWVSDTQPNYLIS